MDSKDVFFSQLVAPFQEARIYSGSIQSSSSLPPAFLPSSQPGTCPCQYCPLDVATWTPTFEAHPGRATVELQISQVRRVRERRAFQMLQRIDKNEAFSLGI